MHLSVMWSQHSFCGCCLEVSPQNRFPAPYLQQKSQKSWKKKANKTESTEEEGAKKEEEEGEQGKTCRKTNLKEAARKPKRKREKEIDVKLCRGRGDCMLLAMLVSHYSTTEFVKWQDNSHLRPCAAAIIQRVRLRLPCLVFVQLHGFAWRCAYASQSVRTCMWGGWIWRAKNKRTAPACRPQLGCRSRRGAATAMINSPGLHGVQRRQACTVIYQHPG